MDEPGRQVVDARDVVSMEEEWRASGLRVFSLLSGVALAGFTVASALAGRPAGAAFIASAIPFAVWSWFMSRARPLHPWAAAPIMLYLMAMFAVLLANEYAGSATVMVFAAAPPLAIFGLGARRGLALSCIAFVVAVITFLVNDHPLPPAYVSRFLVAFAFTAVVAFMYERARERAMSELASTRARVRELEKLLPMCAWCRQINAKEDGWVSVEAYLAKREQTVTHGLCPTCERREMAELDATRLEEDRR